MFIECGQGTYSKSGYEPCILCPRDTYQGTHGKTACVPCHEGGQTWFRGADGSELCFGEFVDFCLIVKQ